MPVLSESIQAVIGDRLSSDRGSAPFSVVFIACTNPVALVFDADGSGPVCVVRSGSRAELERQHAITQYLSCQPGVYVPEPWSIVGGENGTVLAFEAGIAGRPWFQLSSSITTESDWRLLQERLFDALRAFQVAVATNPAWQEMVHPGDSLRKVASEFVKSGVDLGMAADGQLDSLACSLDSLGTVRSFFQHGDFCLNNVVVDRSSIGIVDFEDFGQTAVPLHDWFGLALSITERVSSPAKTATHISQVFRLISESQCAAMFTDSQLRALFVHYLIWMVNHASHERRVARRKELLQWLSLSLA